MLGSQCGTSLQWCIQVSKDAGPTFSHEARLSGAMWT